jgi:hypothetical protein
MLRIVDMIPRSLSGEAGQDAEPNIAVNPQNPQQMVATAFIRDPMNGPNAPVFVSQDQGVTWSIRSIVPGGPGTADISVGFGSTGGTLYAGILNFTTTNLNVLRTGDPFSLTPMTVLVDRAREDQPWVTALTARPGGGVDQDLVFIGHNDFNTRPATASVEFSRDARTAEAPAGFATRSVERRATLGQDGPPVRTAAHPDGTVYVAFQRWVRGLPPGPNDVGMDVVIVRDDAFGAGATPFRSLTDPSDGAVGVRVAGDRFVRFTASTGPLGQERIGADLTIAADPTNSDHVWIGWCDRVGGPQGTDWTMHVRHSGDRGLTWSADLRTVTNAKNPSLAVNSEGLVGLMFQQLIGAGATARWVTQLETTPDGWATPPTSLVLHSALASTPPRKGLPYLGDYLRLLCVDTNFYGVFAGSNLPDPANFPNGVVYHRNADFNSHTLLRTDNVTPVQISIDPFFVHFIP